MYHRLQNFEINLISDCTYGTDEFGLYANSREEYWSELDSRQRKTGTYLNMTKLVEYVDIYCVKQHTWNRIFHMFDKNYTRVNQLFR